MKHPMLRLFSYIKPFKQRFWISVWASCINKVLDLMPPLLVGWVIDSVSGQAPAWIRYVVKTDSPMSMAMFLAVLGFSIFALESVFQWGYQFGFMTLAQKVQHKLRTDAYDALQEREIAYFENHRLGNTMTILNDDINQMERFLNSGFNELVQLVVLFLFAGYVFTATSWQLGIIGLIPLPLVIIGSLIYQQKISPRYAKIREAVGDLGARLENNISGILVIKSFTAEKFESERVNKSSKNYQDLNFNAIRLSTLYVPIIRMAIALGFTGVLMMGSYWVLQGAPFLTVGKLVLFSMLIQRVLWPLTRLGVILDEFERSNASANRVFSILDTPSNIQNNDQAKRLSHVKGEIEFNDVHFHYGNGIDVLKGLNLTLGAGETIGVAGTTGAGKSTLVKMLFRFYDPSSGSLTLDGENFKDLDLNFLRKNLALVSQDVYLFHGSIFENIAYGLENASREEVEHASKLAEFDNFVQSLPDAYDSIVGERGIKLSGGQRQRLSIARAILKDAPIMIFDEATSSVDTETERAIQKNINKLTQGKTALIIAHRLSTIRHADRIVVLDDGVVKEDGHHDDLIAGGGVYADLWNIQIGQGR